MCGRPISFSIQEVEPFSGNGIVFQADETSWEDSYLPPQQSSMSCEPRTPRKLKVVGKPPPRMQPNAGPPHPAFGQPPPSLGDVTPNSARGGDSAGFAYVMPEVTVLSPPPADLQLIKVSRPWKIYRRMLGTVIVTMLLAELLVFIPFGVSENEPLMSICGGLLATPFVFLLVFMRRPNLVHLQRAVPDNHGATLHRLSMGGSLQTPVPTRFAHHIVRDDSLLDIPTSRAAWLVFACLISTTGLLTALFLSSTTGQVIAIVLFIIIGIPAWLLGFSIPVVAWWSWCTRKLGLVTRQREAESWLVAGMLSAIPALVINSILFPEIAGEWFSKSTVDMLMPVVSAPFGEEICKGAFILAFIKSIDNPKRGFQVGFTIGLGFAMLENLIYILGSAFGGPLSFTMTALIRGVGSIPGHAFWTGLTGTGIGWMMMRRRARKAPIEGVQETRLSKPTSAAVEWSLLDPKSGSLVGSDSHAKVQDSTGNNREYRLPLLEPFTGNEQTKAMQTPMNPFSGLFLAISGHAFWNGSLTLLEYAGEGFGLSESNIVLLFLCWSLLLVAGILLLGRGIIRAVLATPTHLPSKVNLRLTQPVP